MLKEYVISYLSTNAFSTFVIFLFYESLFDEKEIKHIKVIKLSAYFLFNAFISLLYLTGFSETAMLISNLLGLFMLTLLYNGKLIQKILFSFLVYGILMAIEVLVFLVYKKIGYNDAMLEKYNYTITLATIVDIISFIAAMLFRTVITKRKEKYMPAKYYYILIILPVVLLFMTYQLSKDGVDNTSVSTIICFLLILLINPLIFVLYELISDKYALQIERILFENNINHYQNQLSVISQSEQKAKQLSHDLNNYLQGLVGMIENNDISGSKEYLEELLNKVNSNSVINTGNHAIDSLINYKLSIMNEKSIEFTSDIYIPENISISNTDITALLGNLLDNAMEASEKTKLKKAISLYMRYDKSNIIITVKNNYSGDLKKENGLYLSSKNDTDNHGIGLKSVYNVTDKYNGLIRIKTDNNVFTVNILLYI